VDYSPRDQLPFFDAPLLTLCQVSLAGGQILEANPDRIGLIWGQSSTASARIGPASNVSGTAGLVVTTTSNPVEVYHSLSGNLCQVAWYGVAIGGPCVVPAIEVILKRWPTEVASHAPVPQAGRAAAAG
jgi:hypothetical protein